MIITRTPVRVSFFGGGTDYPAHFRTHGGRTLAAAIDKYSYITVNRLAPLFDHRIRASYSRTELVRELDELQHPSVRECLRFVKLTEGIEIAYVGDLPAQTGLGSSSSFTVGLLHALHAFKGELVSRTRLAAEAVHVEQDLIGERVGVQDQYACAHGGLVQIEISRDGTVHIAPLPLTAGRLLALQQRLLLFHTGLRRYAHDVLAEQLERTQRGVIANDLRYLATLVDEAVTILSGDGPLARFGELLDAGWAAKKRLSTHVSNDIIDDYYDRAMKAGASGGKLLGAGSGGFLLMCVEPARRAAVLDALRDLPAVDFAFDTTGTTLLFYQA